MKENKTKVKEMDAELDKEISKAFMETRNRFVNKRKSSSLETDSISSDLSSLDLASDSSDTSLISSEKNLKSNKKRTEREWESSNAEKTNKENNNKKTKLDSVKYKKLENPLRKAQKAQKKSMNTSSASSGEEADAEISESEEVDQESSPGSEKQEEVIYNPYSVNKTNGKVLTKSGQKKLGIKLLPASNISEDYKRKNRVRSQQKGWTLKEVGVLVHNYMTNSRLSDGLNRSPAAARNKINAMRDLAKNINIIRSDNAPNITGTGKGPAFKSFDIVMGYECSRHMFLASQFDSILSVLGGHCPVTNKRCKRTQVFLTDYDPEKHGTLKGKKTTNKGSILKTVNSPTETNESDIET